MIMTATYPDKEFVQQVVAQIPWGHNVVILDKVADHDARQWYIEACQRNGWSRNVLVHQIESDLYTRQVIADKVSNFEWRLPSPQSEMAVQTMKDPYIFDFIPFREDMLEQEIEQALVQNVVIGFSTPPLFVRIGEVLLRLDGLWKDTFVYIMSR